MYSNAGEGTNGFSKPSSCLGAHLVYALGLLKAKQASVPTQANI